MSGEDVGDLDGRCPISFLRYVAVLLVYFIVVVYNGRVLSHCDAGNVDSRIN